LRSEGIDYHLKGVLYVNACLTGFERNTEKKPTVRDRVRPDLAAKKS